MAAVVVVYCLVAWAALFKIIDVGVDFFRGEPAHYAHDERGDLKLD